MLNFSITETYCHKDTRGKNTLITTHDRSRNLTIRTENDILPTVSRLSDISMVGGHYKSTRLLNLLQKVNHLTLSNS